MTLYPARHLLVLFLALHASACGKSVRLQSIDAAMDSDTNRDGSAGAGGSSGIGGSGKDGAAPDARVLDASADAGNDAASSEAGSDTGSDAAAFDAGSDAGDDAGTDAGVQCVVPHSADCDGDPSNGCEQYLNTNYHCGACNTRCTRPNGFAACGTLVCRLENCNSGYGNCNNDPDDGCERDLNTVTDCGACDQPCDVSIGETCYGGVCTRTPGCVPSGSEVCDGIDNDCDGTADSGNVCPSGCTGRTGSTGTYALCTAQSNWSAARAACAAAPLSMRLVRINDAIENTFVRAFATDVVGGSGTVWLGANDATVEGEWRWVMGTMIAGPQFWMGGANGSAVGGLYANWATGEPAGGSSESCGQMLANGQWNDTPCGSSTMAFVCEK